MIIKVENELKMGKLRVWSCSFPLLRHCLDKVAYHGLPDILKIVFNSNDAYLKSNQRMHISIYDAYICYKLNKEWLYTYN